MWVGVLPVLLCAPLAVVGDGSMLDPVCLTASWICGRRAARIDDISLLLVKLLLNLTHVSSCKGSESSLIRSGMAVGGASVDGPAAAAGVSRLLVDFALKGAGGLPCGASNLDGTSSNSA